MLRSLFKSDIPQVLTIENAVHISPWTEETFLACLDSGYLGWVLEIEGKIIGFVIISVSLEECHVLNICVLHGFQQQGWGRKLLEAALNHSKQLGVGIAYLEVRKSNTRAISLYRKQKFHLIGERKDYYPTVSGLEDALIFAKSLRDGAP